MRFLLLWLSLVCVLAGGTVRAATPRYYIVLRGVQGPTALGPGDPTAILARDLLLRELRKRAEVTVDGTGLPVEKSALLAELARRRLKGYQFTLRLLSVGRAIHPPLRGKQYRMLERSVKLTLIGTTYPGEMLAVGGDGESTLQAEVGAQITEKQEHDLLSEALHDAIAQAVAQAIGKLDRGGMVPRPEKPRKKK